MKGSTVMYYKLMLDLFSFFFNCNKCEYCLFDIIVVLTQK